MRHQLVTLLLTTMTITNYATAQRPDFTTVKTYEHQLDDVMELIDTTELQVKLAEVEQQYRQSPTVLNKVRVGIIYHETALNLSFLSKTKHKGYAQQSYDLLSGLLDQASTPPALMPFIASYRASALSLVGAETRKLKLIGTAFTLFQDAVDKYAAVSYLPEFLRGSVAENLPWFFFAKKGFARRDFQSILDKEAQQSDYAGWKVMSFTYWAWARQHQGRKDRQQALAYLDKAIDLDPHYKAGRQRAEALKATLKR